MRSHNRMSTLLVEMIGSAAVCGMVCATDVLLGVRRRRAASGLTLP